MEDTNTPEDLSVEEETPVEPVKKKKKGNLPKGRSFSSDSPDFSEIRRKKKPVQRSVDIPLDSTVTSLLTEKEEEIERLNELVERERNRTRDQVGKSLAQGGKTQEYLKQIEVLEAQLDQLWEDAQDVIATFTFQDIGRKAYDDLITDHPPTKEQIKEWEDEGGEGKLGYNTVTFPPALMSVTSVSPKLTYDEAEEIYNEWGNFEVIRLFNAAQAACVGVSKIPKSRRSLIDTDETTNSA